MNGGGGWLAVARSDQRVEASEALAAHKAQLARVAALAGIDGVILPSAGLDPVGKDYRGEIFPDLGRIRPLHLDLITMLLREALDARERRLG